MTRIPRPAQIVALCGVLLAALLVGTGAAHAAQPVPPSTLTQVEDFGLNPSDLSMYAYVPTRVARRPALLVAMHGCGGSAQDLYDGSAHDFVTAAEQYGFVIVFPEAARTGGCFDVSSAAALTRNGGSDPVGILSMIRYAQRTFHVDPDRVTVTGVSAGAAMTTVLAAEYPDVIAAGSVFSGAPAGCFATTDDPDAATRCSNGQTTRTAQEWGDLARAMDPGHTGAYPRLQFWHGTADPTISFVNWGEEIEQWTDLTGVSQTAVATDSPEPSWSRTRYGATTNEAPVEGIRVSGAGNTLPLHLMAQYAVAFLGLNRAGGGTVLPSTYAWTSSQALIAPTSDATHSIVSVKDPSVVRYKNQWLVYATTVNSAGHYSMEYLTFSDWADASTATPYYLDQSAIGTGYRAAPELFYVKQQKLWYLVYQSDQGASYSTTTDPTRPETWSATQGFFSSTPEIIQQHIGTGNWVDMWVICDTADCYLFSSDDNGNLYRSQTTLANFPQGFGDTVIALDSPTSKYRLFEASNVYKVRGTDSYVLIVEASASARYFRAWTSNRLDGAWTPLAVSQANPFMGASNTTFTETAWTTSISHGEMVRDGYDQTPTINPHHLQYLYQGVDPTAGTSYTLLPWHLGLLTLTSTSSDTAADAVAAS